MVVPQRWALHKKHDRSPLETNISLKSNGVLTNNNARCSCSYVVERRVGRTEAWKKIRAGDARGDTTTTVGRSSPKRRDGGIRGTKGQHGSTDAVDAPLRSVSVDALRKVAVEGLLIAYR